MEIRHIEKRKLNAFTTAIYEGDYSRLQELLTTQSKQVYQSDANGLNPLLAAALVGDNDIIELLLSYSIDPNFGDAVSTHKPTITSEEHELANSSSRRAEFTYNSLRMAISECHIDTVYLLLQKGADLNLLEHQEQVYLLEMACQNQEHGLVKALLKEGISPNSKINKSGETAIYLAVRQDDPTLCALLIQFGAHANWKNLSHKSPLDYVTSAECTRLLLKSGAHFDLDIEHHPQNAFDTALKNQYFSAAKEMLEFKRQTFIQQLKTYCHHKSFWWAKPLFPITKWLYPKQMIVYESLQDEQQQTIEAILSNIKNTLDQKKLKQDVHLRNIIELGDVIVSANKRYQQGQETPKLHSFKTLTVS